MADNTKDQILDAAEKLFATHGFAGTSLRAITAEAKVNLAAVNYHFQSKEGLIAALYDRLLAPINAERIQLLDQFEASASSEGPTLEKILEAMMRPVMEVTRDRKKRRRCQRLIGLTYHDDAEALQKIFLDQFSEIKMRFAAAFRKAIPGLQQEDFFWAMHFTVGAMANHLSDTFRLKMISDGICDADDVETVLRQIIRYTAAGMRSGEKGN